MSGSPISLFVCCFLLFSFLLVQIHEETNERIYNSFTWVCSQASNLSWTKEKSILTDNVWERFVVISPFCNLIGQGNWPVSNTSHFRSVLNISFASNYTWLMYRKYNFVLFIYCTELLITVRSVQLVLISLPRYLCKIRRVPPTYYGYFLSVLLRVVLVLWWR